MSHASELQPQPAHVSQATVERNPLYAKFIDYCSLGTNPISLGPRGNRSLSIDQYRTQPLLAGAMHDFLTKIVQLRNKKMMFTGRSHPIMAPTLVERQIHTIYDRFPIDEIVEERVGSVAQVKRLEYIHRFGELATANINAFPEIRLADALRTELSIDSRFLAEGAAQSLLAAYGQTIDLIPFDGKISTYPGAVRNDY